MMMERPIVRIWADWIRFSCAIWFERLLWI